MKLKVLKTIAIGSLFMLPLGVALAEGNIKQKTPVKPVMPVMKEIREKIASTSEKIENRIDDRREKLLDIARNKLDKMIKRFEATLDREDVITSKIISRIEKVKSNGGNTTDAEKFVDEAKMHFGLARTALTTLKTATSSASTLVDGNNATSTIIKNGLKKLKDMAQNVEKHIREGHNSLTKAVKSLRGMSSANASTTPNSSN